MKRALTIGAALALALALAGCGKGGSGTGDGGSSAPGVTDKTITLGALVDLTNVFAPNSKSILHGVNTYWDDVNKDGGVCGRQVKLDVGDHEYDPQKAVSLYRDMSSKVLALSPVLGSSVMTALLPSYEQDNMLVGMAAWTSDVLPNPLIQITGTTYDLEIVNAVDWLMREKGLKKGDTVGIVYFEGDYGGTAVKGLDYAAKRVGLKEVKQQIQPTDTDLSAQVNAMKSKDVKAIFMAAASPQTASVASVAKSIGLDVPIVGNSPAFTPDLLDTPAGPALEENFYTSSSVAPPAVHAPQVKKFLAAFQKAHPGEQPIQNGSAYGYASAQIMDKIISGTCDDLTREGLEKSFRSLSNYDSGGMVAGTLDYSDPSVPPTREVYISKADKSVPGGLKPVGEPFTSQMAKDYSFSG